MQDLSSPTKDQIRAPLQWKLKVLTTELPGNFPFFLDMLSIIAGLLKMLYVLISISPDSQSDLQL